MIFQVLKVKVLQGSALQSADNLVFYVSPNGKDNWSGRIENPNRWNTDGPLATIQQARNLIRQIKINQGGILDKTVTVFIRNGTYYLEEPIVFLPEDSGTANFPIIYRAYPGEKPVISGGRQIKNWRRIRENIWVAKLPDVKAKKWYFRLLRVGEHWAIRCRYPKFNPEQALTEGWLFAKNSSPSKDKIVVDSEFFPNWSNWEGAEVNIFPDRGWANSILQVNNVERESNTLFINSERDIIAGNRFFIENVAEALNSPGEWYLDKNTGDLIYWPLDKNFPKNVEVVAPFLDRCIILQGVEHIHFQKLKFTDTNYKLNVQYFSPLDAAIWLINARHCEIKDCTFNLLGGYAVRLENKSNENKIIGNTMSELGEGGVFFWPAQFEPSNNLIASNNIWKCGKIYKGIDGIHIRGTGNKVIDNYISKMPRTGIFINAWLETTKYNIVQDNVILDTSLETNDSGAIYIIAGRKHNDNVDNVNIVQFNYIKNSGGLITNNAGFVNNEIYTFGIYLDDYSSNIKIWGNIIVNSIFGAVCIHGGKNNTIENNIFINGLQHQIRLQPIDEFMENNIFRRNIIVFENSNATVLSSSKELWQSDKKLLAECDFNLYWHTEGLNLLQKPIFLGKTFSQWQNLGFDRNSIIGDPLFIDLDEENFDFRSNSPAFRINFQRIPLKIIKKIVLLNK
ncbi:MAG: right-handed parallel beta-helix repeat-containing protein [candidate division WOR-3 bacterium]